MSVWLTCGGMYDAFEYKCDDKLRNDLTLQMTLYVEEVTGNYVRDNNVDPREIVRHVHPDRTEYKHGDILILTTRISHV